MKSNIYESPSLEVVHINTGDIITASDPRDPFMGEDDSLNV